MKALYRMVGMKYCESAEFVDSLPIGTPMQLVRQHDNPHDANAVRVMYQGRHVAYVQATQAVALARRMDLDANPVAGTLVGDSNGRYVQVNE